MPRRIAGPRAVADHLRKLSELTPEDQPQNKPDSERSKYRLRRIFAHILLRIILKCAGAIPCIPPGLFRFAPRFTPGLLCLAAVFTRNSAGRRFQIFRSFARMFLAALQFVLRVSRSGRLLFWFVFLCHW